MKLSKAAMARAACAYFFFCPGLAYGIFTSRLPALKEQVGADEAQIGMLLFSLGAASLVALVSSSIFIAKLGSRLVLRIGSLMLILGICLCGLAASPLMLAIFCAFAGLGMGLTDVSMNAQGLQHELRFHTPCMSLMHASYSLGGVVGALSGALFAGLELGVLANAVVVLGLYACLRPWAVPKLFKERALERRAADVHSDGKKSFLPPFVFFCGLLSTVAYASEGAVAEWGSLLLHTVKGTEQSIAAFAFAAFSTTTVCCRIFGDRLRSAFGDFRLAFCGGGIAVCGISLALFAHHPALCLFGFALMGAGLSPLVPILFSRAGSQPGVTPAKASAVVSTMSYTGLLFFPPMLGFLANVKGLDNAMLVVLAACIFLWIGSLLLRKG